jgi:hypothetical protein
MRCLRGRRAELRPEAREAHAVRATGGGYGSFNSHVTFRASYRWTTSNGNSSRISQNLCSNLDYYNYRDFPAGNTSWRELNLPGAQGHLGSFDGCFLLRGRALSGDVISKDAQLYY